MSTTRNTQELPKQKVSIVFIGGQHADLAPIHAETDLVIAANNKNIPLIFCDEMPNISLAQEIKLNKSIITKSEAFINNSSLKELLKTSPHFKFLDYEKVLDIVRNRSTSDLEIQANFHAVIQYSARKELEKFYNLLVERSIQYVGIDDGQLVATVDILNAEQLRITIMVREIVRRGLSELAGENGILVVNCGSVHVHRLAVNFALYIEKNRDLKKVDFQISTMKIFSSDFVEEISMNESADAERVIPTDPSNVQRMYGVIPCNKIEFAEEKGHYVSDKLAGMIHKIIDFPINYNIFLVPDFDDDKEKLLNELGGRVIHSADRNRLAKIQVNTDLLKKSIRDQLGIDRLQITLPRENAKERCQYLKLEGVTVEHGTQLNKFIVTFPKNKRPLVEKVVSHWPKIVSDREELEKRIFASQKALKAILSTQEQLRKTLKLSKSGPPEESPKLAGL